MRIGFPAHLFKIPDQVLSVFVDHKSMLTGMTPQPGVYAGDAIFHRGIGAWARGR